VLQEETAGSVWDACAINIQITFFGESVRNLADRQGHRCAHTHHYAPTGIVSLVGTRSMIIHLNIIIFVSVVVRNKSRYVR
jgi:hypothetical protein